MKFLKQKKFLAAFIFVISFFSLATPQASFAKSGLVPCGGYKDDGVTPEAPCKFTDIFVLFARVTNWLVGLSGLYAVYNIILNGFWLILSQGNEEVISTHKKGITNAIVGMVLVLFAYIIINFVINGILVGGMPGKKLDLTNPTCYLSPTTQSECFISAQ